MSNISTNTVANYYNTNQLLSNMLWHKAFHYGFWDKTTKNLRQSIYNTNLFVAECLQINSSDIVLDAGCGAGETSIFFAEKFGAKMTGISLSEVQIAQAKRQTKKSFASHLVDFAVMDYTKSDFPDNFFTKIFALESVCHAFNKIDFLKEVYRLLKPKGRLVVSDFFFGKNKNRLEKNYQECIDGWAVPYLTTGEEFQQQLATAGFRNIQRFDKSNEIKKSAGILHTFAIVSYPFSWIGMKLGITAPPVHPHCVACINQKYLFAEGVMNYFVFTAEK